MMNLFGAKKCAMALLLMFTAACASDPVQEKLEEEVEVQSSCPEPKLINFKKPYSYNDILAIRNAQLRCRVIYKHSKCLKYIAKTNLASYRAVCSRNR